MDLSTIILFNLTISKVGTSVSNEGYIAIAKAIYNQNSLTYFDFCLHNDLLSSKCYEHLYSAL